MLYSHAAMLYVCLGYSKQNNHLHVQSWESTSMEIQSCDLFFSVSVSNIRICHTLVAVTYISCCYIHILGRNTLLKDMTVM